MRPRLVFATRNTGKVVEVRELLADLDLELVSIAELDAAVPEVDEDADTFVGNATKKALEISRATSLPTLADDSGLEVDALGGAPGVKSARFAGPGATTPANNAKLLQALGNVPDDRRSARFQSVLVLADTAGALGQDVIVTQGTCEGQILRGPRGTGGFGYDPLFYVPELGCTFAELGVGSKNNLSHRARAMTAMKPHLVRYFQLAKPAPSG